ncbi:MAG: cryptochrome/photolyase family protein [Arachnia sp.]
MTSILWLRRDLRLRDLPALNAAAADGPVLALVILDERLLRESPTRAAGMLAAVAAAQGSYDGAIVVRWGAPEEILPGIVREVGATAVHISAESQPYGRLRDERVRRVLDVPLVATGLPYAVGPGTLRSAAGTPFRVFTPFSRAWRDHAPPPAMVPAGVRFIGAESTPLPALPETRAQLALPGESAALKRWAAFLDAVDGYDTDRDRPDLAATSGLSADLAFGTIHPRTLLADLAGRTSEGAFRFVSELAWREFCADVLWHHPEAEWSDLTGSLAAMAYDDPETDPSAAAALAAWAEGRTGYPIVDAGQRQLLATGWMHNRARMITASFLTKHLHVWWVHGARHFMRHLLDGDAASNSQGWQWVAGTGTDAAPYFRVFNPITQAKKFDPDGDYVRSFVPELRHLPGATVHEPWRSDGGYDQGYPQRMVDLAVQRAEALRRYQAGRRKPNSVQMRQVSRSAQ